jgi:hypothetical protein
VLQRGFTTLRFHLNDATIFLLEAYAHEREARLVDVLMPAPHIVVQIYSWCGIVQDLKMAGTFAHVKAPLRLLLKK